MSKIIMIGGGIGSGKAYQMNKMISNLKETGNSIAVLSFADPIKQFLKELSGYDKNGNLVGVEENLTYKQIKNKVSQLINNNAEMDWLSVWPKDVDDLILKLLDDILVNISNETPIHERKKFIREALQLIGTDIAHIFRKDIWPNCQFKKIDTIKYEFDYIIIDDWRFLFEFITAQLRFQHSVELIPYYILASEETRAKRRNISVEELMIQSQHISERESYEVILPFMRLYYPDNIINGENE